MSDINVYSQDHNLNNTWMELNEPQTVSTLCEVLKKSQYKKLMHLKIFIDTDDEGLKTEYKSRVNEHNNKLLTEEHIDAGFDLLVPKTYTQECGNSLPKLLKLDHKVKCSARFVVKDKEIPSQKMVYQINPPVNLYKYPTGYYMYPRSSIYKTPFRLANSVGIIDSGYRGNLIAMLDLHISTQETVECERFSRLMQICAPDLSPIYVEIVNSVEKLGHLTTRGDGGFGSTGV